MDAAQRLTELLEASGRPVRWLEHAYADTAESVAEARGTPLAIGGKSLVFKLPDGFALFVLSGARRVDSKAIRRRFGGKLRFATREELHALTGLVPGCVPPFGRPLFEVELYVDAHTAEQPEIAFSAAEHTRSARMATADYLAVAQPADIFRFSRP